MKPELTSLIDDILITDGLSEFEKMERIESLLSSSEIYTDEQHEEHTSPDRLYEDSNAESDSTKGEKKFEIIMATNFDNTPTSSIQFTRETTTKFEPKSSAILLDNFDRFVEGGGFDKYIASGRLDRELALDEESDTDIVPTKALIISDKPQLYEKFESLRHRREYITGNISEEYSFNSAHLRNNCIIDSDKSEYLTTDDIEIKKQQLFKIAMKQSTKKNASLYIDSDPDIVRISIAIWPVPNGLRDTRGLYKFFNELGTLIYFRPVRVKSSSTVNSPLINLAYRDNTNAIYARIIETLKPFTESTTYFNERSVNIRQNFQSVLDLTVTRYRIMAIMRDPVPLELTMIQTTLKSMRDIDRDLLLPQQMDLWQKNVRQITQGFKGFGIKK
ncbi:hypothetical protein V1511DRAFT_490015 [Dipodascopsis uninucleata]